MTSPDSDRLQNPQLYISDGCIVIGAWRDVLISIWRDSPTVARQQALHKHLAELVSARAFKASFLGIVEETTPIPSDDVRRAATVMMKALGSQLRSVAIVLEGGGIKAAVTRSMLRYMALLSKHPCPTRYWACVDEASSWMASFYEQDDAVISGTTLATAVAALRNASRAS